MVPLLQVTLGLVRIPIVLLKSRLVKREMTCPGPYICLQSLYFPELLPGLWECSGGYVGGVLSTGVCHVLKA